MRELQSGDELAISFVKDKNTKEVLSINGDKDPLYVEFKEYLNEVIAEIFDKDKTFKSTDKSSDCDYCPYVSLCSLYKTKKD